MVAGSAGNLYEPGVSSLPYPGNGRGLSLDGLDGPVQQAGAVMDELLSNIAKFSPGNGVSGRVGGDCWGDNLASATNQLLMMQLAGASAQQLSRVIAEAAAAITAKMHGSGTAQDVMLRALLKDMGLALRDLSATVVGAIAARDQDPARTDGGCADAAASLDRTHSARFGAAMENLLAESLAVSGGRDASVSSWAEADALRVASLVTGKGMAAEPVFKSDWLTPSSRLISGADLDRTVLSATVVGAIAARDQDPARTDGGCADAAASLDRTHSARFGAAMENLLAESLAVSGGRDASVSSWAEADALRVASLVTGKGMAAEPVFKSDWLTPSSRLISGADLDRTVLMMAALSNPHPAPSVPERQRGTVAGRRADAEIKLKSASVSAAQAALADVAAAYAPAGYRNAVPDLEERSGIESASRTSPGRETGNYSSMQYLEARAGYFSSLRMADDVNRMIAADVLRNIYHIEAEAFSLNVQRYRADLHRNAVLSAMLGIMTEAQNSRVAGYLGQTREK